MSEKHPRIYFFTPFCLLRNTTNRIFDMRMSHAFAEAGCRVTIVFPYSYLKENLSKKNLHSYYGVENNFKLIMLPTPLHEKLPAVFAFLIIQLAFFLFTLRIILSNFGGLNNVVILSREISPVLPAMLIKKIFGKLFPVRIIPQLHELKNEPLKKFGYKNASGLMVNVPRAKEIIIQELKIKPEKILVMNAPVVDFSKTDYSKQEARKKIGYSRNNPLVVYSGKIAKSSRELIYILDAAAILPQYIFMMTGGKEKNIMILKDYCLQKKIENVEFTGFLENIFDVRLYQLAADVLVSYYTSKDHPVEFNYPQKLQEYLSTGNPVVTPLHEATCEVITEDLVFAVEPDNPAALAAGIRLAAEDKINAQSKSSAAFAISKKNTYEKKVFGFLQFLNTIR